MIAKLSDICFSYLAKFSCFSHSPLKIILKQLFPSGSVNITEYLLSLRRILVKYKHVNEHFKVYDSAPSLHPSISHLGK